LTKKEVLRKLEGVLSALSDLYYTANEAAARTADDDGDGYAALTTAASLAGKAAGWFEGVKGDLCRQFAEESEVSSRD
jgi:hypothetical protein